MYATSLSLYMSLLVCLLMYLPLQATMVVADAEQSLTITGNGDVLEPHDGIIGTQPDLLSAA